MVDWNFYAEAKRREQERIAEAQHIYLWKSIATHANSRMALLDRCLAWLGGCLVATGTRLQMQFK